MSDKAKQTPAPAVVTTSQDRKEMARAWSYGIRPLFKNGAPFNPQRDIPAQTDKVILVTGAAGGIGAAAAMELARHKPAQLWIADLNEAAAQTVMAAIAEEVPDVPVHFLHMDLGDAASVRRAAGDFLARTERLDTLMLNAGILPARTFTTKDGFEAMFGVNFVGHARLTDLLLPRLLETASLPGADVRVVVVSSAGHGIHPKPDGIVLGEDGKLLRHESCGGESTFARYGQSKLALLLWARRLAREFPTLTTVSLHPGNVATGIAVDFSDGKKRPLLDRLTGVKPPTVGAMNQLWAATAPRGKVVSGKYYHPVGVPDQEYTIARDRARSDALEDKLWDWLQKELSKGKEGGTA